MALPLLAAAGVLILAIANVLCCCCIRKRRADRTFSNDGNPDYGDYADPEAVTEVTDHNEDYGEVCEGANVVNDNNSQYEFSME